MSHVATVPHELRASLVWDDHDDSPYWALRQLFDAAEGGGSFEIVIDALDPLDPSRIDDEVEQLDVTLSYQPSGIAPRPSDEVSELYEYRVYWQHNGQRYGGLIQPRFEADEFRKAHRGDRPDRPWRQREKIDVPPNLGEAVAWKIDAGAYAVPDYYPRMLSRVLKALASELGVDWNHEYFAGPPDPDLSTITDFERTLRYTRGASKQVTKRGGILDRIWQLLANLEGSKREYSADDTEIEGYIHQLRLDSTAASELLPGRRRGQQLKSYHPREVRDAESKDDPLYHPRFGVLFSKSWNDHAGVPWRDRDDLSRELHETLINVLAWADIPIDPDSTTYVADDYFSVEPSHIEIGLYDDPTPEIEREQEALLVREFAELAETDLEALEQLVADGGEAHYEELSHETGRAISTIYRVLDRVPELIESDDGTVRFVSEKIRQDIAKIVEVQREQLTTAADAVAHMLNLDRETLRQRGGALQKWLEKYAVELVETGDRPTFKIRAIVDRLRSTDVPELDDVLDEGLRAWRDAGLDPEEYHRARVSWKTHGGEIRHGIVKSALR